jgi:hypothetical protein
MDRIVVAAGVVIYVAVDVVKVVVVVEDSFAGALVVAVRSLMAGLLRSVAGRC